MSENERNPFLSAADDFLLPEPVKRRAAAKARAFDRRQAEKLRAPGATERKLREKSRLTAGFRRAERRRWRAALAGPHGKDFVALRRTMRRFGAGDGAALLAYIRQETARWISTQDVATRRIAWGVVSHRLERIRAELGLPALDDPIPPLVAGDPGQSPNIGALCFAAILPEQGYPVSGDGWLPYEQAEALRLAK